MDDDGKEGKKRKGMMPVIIPGGRLKELEEIMGRRAAHLHTFLMGIEREKWVHFGGKYWP